MSQACNARPLSQAHISKVGWMDYVTLGTVLTLIIHESSIANQIAWI